MRKERRFKNEVRKTASKERRLGAKGATRNLVRKERQPVAWQNVVRYTAVVSIVIVAVMAGVWLQQKEILPVLHVTVEGQFESASQSLLEKAVKPYVTGNFLTINVAELRKVGKAQAWIKDIQVKRSWPDSLHLVVEEQNAIAQWGDDALVNTEGELFFPAKASFPKGLVKLGALNETSKELTQRYVDIVAHFAPLDLVVSQLKMDKRHALFIQFDGGMTLLLGRADNDKRIMRFKTLYQSGLRQYKNEIETVDMRYTNGVAVAWKLGRLPDFNRKV